MRPIVIIKETNKEGKFELTEKELRELVEKAYEQGFEDGKQERVNIQGVPYWNWRSIGDPSTPTFPHDIYGNPIPYCGGTTVTDPKDTRATLNLESNDLVYRGWEHNYKFPKQGEPIPCEINQTSSKPNPSITAWNTANSKQPNEDTYKGEQSR